MSTVKELLERLTESRLKLHKKIGDVADESMTLPIPNRSNMQIRSVFYRLIAHEIEHTIHLSKTLASLNIQLSEAKQILQELQESRGKLESLLLTLDDSDLDRKPSKDDWSPREVVNHILEVEENSYSELIIDALKNK